MERPNIPPAMSVFIEPELINGTNKPTSRPIVETLGLVH